ncbi:MAG: STAS domain-containing protein [Candidatus Riflebacteria bacterium]|nr:STAS domain-containing protein [Candidatus Riflebacteria bacterium]
MKINLTRNDAAKTKTFALEGEMDVHHVNSIKSQVQKSLEPQGSWTYILDLKDVTYLDSSGLGTLVYLKKEVAKNAGEMKIINIQDAVLNVFKLTKLDAFFGIK